MRITDDNGILYSMMPINTPDFARLLAAVGGRCKLLAGAGEPTLDLRLRLIYVNGDSGPPLVEVTVPGPTPEAPRTVSAYVARSRLPTPDHLTGEWSIHHPEQGPQMGGFNTCQQVAKFLSVVPTFAEGWQEVWQQWMDARDPVPSGVWLELKVA